MENEHTLADSPLSDGVRPIDQAVLDLLRRREGLTVQELIDQLEVTATAVRQRLDRLVQVDMLERRKVVAGRGRPQFRYYLTSLGMRYASASYSGLALALWQEVMELPSQAMRQRILRRVGRRMGLEMKGHVPGNGSLSERMTAVAEMLTHNRIPSGIEHLGELPVLQVHACPYPELSKVDGQRSLCELEAEMISEAVGQPMVLDSCRLDGHSMCQYRAATSDLTTSMQAMQPTGMPTSAVTSASTTLLPGTQP